MVTVALQADQKMNLVTRVEVIEVPRGFRVWKVIPVRGGVVPVFVMDKPRVSERRGRRPLPSRVEFM